MADDQFEPTKEPLSTYAGVGVFMDWPRLLMSRIEYGVKVPLSRYVKEYRKFNQLEQKELLDGIQEAISMVNASIDALAGNRGEYQPYKESLSGDLKENGKGDMVARIHIWVKHTERALDRWGTLIVGQPAGRDSTAESWEVIKQETLRRGQLRLTKELRERERLQPPAATPAVAPAAPLLPKPDVADGTVKSDG